MSDLSEKLEPVRTEAGRARATLEQLIRMWGSPRDLDPKKPPEFIVVDSMGEKRLWFRKGTESGPKTVYERVDDDA